MKLLNYHFPKIKTSTLQIFSSFCSNLVFFKKNYNQLNMQNRHLFFQLSNHFHFGVVSFQFFQYKNPMKSLRRLTVVSGVTWNRLGTMDMRNTIYLYIPLKWGTVLRCMDLLTWIMVFVGWLLKQFCADWGLFWYLNYTKNTLKTGNVIKRTNIHLNDIQIKIKNLYNVILKPLSFNI